MANKKADSYALLTPEAGWISGNRPAPYDSWGLSGDPDHCSSYNISSTKTPSKLNAFAVKALLSVVDNRNSDIGICRITCGSYASQWTQPDGSVILAHAMKNGALTAAIREPSGRFKSIPGLGNKNTDFDPTSIIALFLLIEADRAKETGNTRTVTWELLEECRKTFGTTGVLDEKTLYLVNDALYYGLTYPNGIPCNMKAGNIAMLVQRRLESGEFQSADVIAGNPDLLVPPSVKATASNAGAYDIAAAKKEFDEYIRSRQWPPEEEDMIPVFPDDMPVPEEVVKIARRFVKSREFRVPLNNFCWRGGTGFGKSTGAEILACVLHTPFVRITCSSGTELNDFLSQFVPNPDSDSDTLRAALPSFEDIKCDPVGAYEILTGKSDEGVEEAALAERAVTRRISSWL